MMFFRLGPSEPRRNLDEVDAGLRRLLVALDDRSQGTIGQTWPGELAQCNLLDGS
jgi:hypothetical protein